MLKSLHLKGVGPAPELKIDFAKRLNILTGDNGLGKSFMLDIAWWVLTGIWVGEMACPNLPDASITFGFNTRTSQISRFSSENQEWLHPVVLPAVNSRMEGTPFRPEIVSYVRVDGGYSVWDSARNSGRHLRKNDQNNSGMTNFNNQEIWDGKDKICEGMIRDVVSWQRSGSHEFAQYTEWLKRLSPHESEILQPGEPTRYSLDDPREHPTIRTPYGQDVPLVLASAGVKRIVGLAYLLVWSWKEHLVACRIKGLQPTKNIVVLIDEVETHLHPKWQRSILPSLTMAMENLFGGPQVQIIATTHAPLVLASLETLFEEEKDCLFHFQLTRNNMVSLEPLPWSVLGQVDNWLCSDIFGLAEPRSLEAEQAIGEAKHAMKSKMTNMIKLNEIETKLKQFLPSVDGFWVRWTYFRQCGKMDDE